MKKMDSLINGLQKENVKFDIISKSGELLKIRLTEKNSKNRFGQVARLEQSAGQQDFNISSHIAGEYKLRPKAKQ